MRREADAAGARTGPWGARGAAGGMAALRLAEVRDRLGEPQSGLRPELTRNGWIRLHDRWIRRLSV